MGVTVDETGEQRLAPSVVDVGVGIRFERLVGGIDCYNAVTFDHKRHVILHSIGTDDGGMSEDYGPARCGLSPKVALPEKECRSTGTGEHLPPTEGTLLL